MREHPVILYVEDDKQSRMVMEVLLVEDMGLSHVFIFEDSTNFLTRLESLERKPELVFLDIHVRPHSGFDMLAMLREHADFQDVPVVALTASVMNEEVVRLRTAGFDGVVAKPIKLEAFPAIMDKVLRGEEVWQIVS
jgi:CheY-like chemotaxis protein